MQNPKPSAMTGAPVPHQLRRPRQAAAWLFVGVVIGYPVAGLLASAMDWDSLKAAIPLRILILALSAWVWLTARNPGRRRGGLWLALFGAAYMLRLIWDVGVTQVPGAVEALAFFVATVAIPAAALWRGGSSLSEAHAMRLMFVMGSAICILALGMHTLGIGQERSLTDATGRLSFEALNPITIGHTAVSTLIAGLCMVRHGLKPDQAPLLLAGGMAAGTTLLLAASRGPLLCLAAAGVVFALATGRWFWLALISLALAPFLFAADSELMMRFVTIEEDESTLERLLLQSNAIDQFVSRPLLGSAFVELELLTYPHNLFVETAMALGMVGLLLLLMVLAKAWRAVGRHFDRGQVFIALILAQYFVGAQLSGAIYGHGPLAASLVLLLGATRPRTSRAVSRCDAPAQNNSMSTGIA